MANTKPRTERWNLPWRQRQNNPAASARNISAPHKNQKQRWGQKQNPLFNKAKKPKPAIFPGPHLQFDLMVSPTRIMRAGWSDEALERIYEHSREEGFIKDISDAYKLQLRRSQRTELDKKGGLTDDGLTHKEREACIRIVRETSSKDYEASTSGWNMSDKRTEMSDPNMMYILMRTKTGQEDYFSPGFYTDIAAFISFKLDYDDPPNEHRQVIYIYEVHIAEKLRGRGLGRFLMSTVEACAHDVGVNKTMLTVFRTNPNAMRAYEKMGYTKDESTPADTVTRRGRRKKCDYLIMSKTWTGPTGEVSN